ncbi:MAG: hypothetical protein PF549_02165, partial [Patescibacteria group bacterium]|nr:hypothetical protein [Patescibacteria group bacterium]
MELTPKKDIYHIYEIEASNFNAERVDFFWKNFFQAGGVFVFMTFVVFFMINFRFISIQLADWYDARDYRIVAELSPSSENYSKTNKYLISEVDSDNDGVNDRIEEVIGTDMHSIDSDNDGYTDFHEISNGYNPLGEGFLKAEIKIGD